MKTITQSINETAEVLSEDDFEWLIPQLMDFYKDKINQLAYKSYSSTLNEAGTGTKVARDAFSEIAKDEITKALNTFLFKSQLWKSKRDINTYLIHSLNNLSTRVQKDVEGNKIYLAPVCPHCKETGKREYLVSDGKLLVCQECTRMAKETSQRVYLVFSKHSKRGYKCPDCEKFIPESANTEKGISCPYDNCSFFGNISNMVKMSHPVGMSNRIMYSINQKFSYSEQTLEDKINDNNNINPDSQLEIHETFNNNYNLLKSIMSEQLNKAKLNNNITNIIQKTLMYEAYLSILEKYPHDMVGYLIHKRSRTDFPLQSKIFQEYVRIVQDSLPYTMKRGGKEINITSLLDPKLSLFDGISKYEAIVRADGSIGNQTKERYIGSYIGKDYGCYFIGYILDIIDKTTNKSIKNKINSYSFCEIKMNDVKEGLPVEVTHYRLYPHYEIGSMVWLQKIRKKIISRITAKNKNK